MHRSESDADIQRNYQEYARTIYKYLLSLTRDEQVAEELTQETFFQAIQSCEKYDGSCSMATWLCAIAKHLFIDEKRRQGKAGEMPEDIALQDKAVEQTAVERDDSFRVHMALHAMEEPYREVFELRVFGELSFQQIGRIFNKTENWARVTFHRARAKLKERMA